MQLWGFKCTIFATSRKQDARKNIKNRRLLRKNDISDLGDRIPAKGNECAQLTLLRARRPAQSVRISSTIYILYDNLNLLKGYFWSQLAFNSILLFSSLPTNICVMKSVFKLVIRCNHSPFPLVSSL